MRIGIDLDGVVFDSEKEFRILSELYDMKELKQNSKIDNGQVTFQKRFNWSKEQQSDFFNSNVEWIIKNANVMPGAKRILNMLKEEGNELIVITARGTDNPEIINISKEIIKEKGLDIFDKYIYSARDKMQICKDENIDVMIDDTTENCKKISDAGVRTIYFKDAASLDLPESKNLKTLYNWGEVYRELGKN